MSELKDSIKFKGIPVKLLYVGGTVGLVVGGFLGLETYAQGGRLLDSLSKNREAEALQMTPTESPSKVRGSIAISEDVLNNFIKSVDRGEILPQNEGGFNKNYLHGFMITINGVDFGLVGTNPDGINSEWWFKELDSNPDIAGWSQLKSVEKTGINSSGQDIEVTSLMLGDNDVFWFPSTIEALNDVLQNPDNQGGIVFKPPPGSKSIPNYDRSSNKGILIPMSKQVENNPYSVESIFEGIEYRTGANFTPTEIPFQIVDKEKQIMTKAGKNFLTSLHLMSHSNDARISETSKELIELQSKKQVIIVMSIPDLDAGGNLEQKVDVPMDCGYTDDGSFEIIVNSTLFAQTHLERYELTAANIMQCLESRKYIENKFLEYKNSNPNLTITEALKKYPFWLQDAYTHGWFVVAKELLSKNQEIIPKNSNSLYRMVYDKFVESNGDESLFNKLIRSTLNNIGLF